MHKYERIIYWSKEDEKFIVIVPELPGCMADGNTPEEALKNSDIIHEIVRHCRTINAVDVRFPLCSFSYRKVLLSRKNLCFTSWLRRSP